MMIDFNFSETNNISRVIMWCCLFLQINSSLIFKIIALSSHSWHRTNCSGDGWLNFLIYDLRVILFFAFIAAEGSEELGNFVKIFAFYLVRWWFNEHQFLTRLHIKFELLAGTELCETTKRCLKYLNKAWADLFNNSISMQILDA